MYQFLLPDVSAGGSGIYRPVSYTHLDVYKRQASVRGYLQIAPIKGLSYKMSLSIDYNSKFSPDYTNPTYGKEPLVGSVSKRNYRTTGMTFNNVVNWEHKFKELHNIRLMAGQEYYEYNTSNFGGSRSVCLLYTSRCVEETGY